MNEIKDGGLLRAAKGSRGDLDAWLELHNEDEVREAILEIADQKTLRDEFAGKAMQGWLATYGPSDQHPADRGFCGVVAEQAYALADSMLAAREAQP